MQTSINDIEKACIQIAKETLCYVDYDRGLISPDKFYRGCEKFARTIADALDRPAEIVTVNTFEANKSFKILASDLFWFITRSENTCYLLQDICHNLETGCSEECKKQYMAKEAQKWVEMKPVVLNLEQQNALKDAFAQFIQKEEDAQS